MKKEKEIIKKLVDMGIALQDEARQYTQEKVKHDKRSKEYAELCKKEQYTIGLAMGICLATNIIEMEILLG